MSPKHNEKTIGILAVLLLATTMSLGFMVHRLNEKPVAEVEKVTVQIPVIVPMIDIQELMIPLSEEIPVEEPLEGADLYASYVDEIVNGLYPDVNPLEVKAIIQNESHYVPDAVNPKSGTTGLMQINPKWHAERANRLGVEDLTDPYGNILVGCDLLHELQQTNSEAYALNVFAGGYAYANAYQNGKSPYEKLTEATMTAIANGEIVLGGD